MTGSAKQSISPRGEQSGVLRPLPREAVGRGRGWRVPRQTRCQRSKLIDPPTPPRHTQRRVEGGEMPGMTSRSLSRGFAISPRVFARGLIFFPPASKRGRRESRVRAAPAVSRANGNKETHTSIQVQRKQSGLPCAMVLTVSFGLSPVIGLSCHRRWQNYFRQLDASVEASGPHDFSVRKQSALVSSAARVHRIQPRVRDDRDTPLEWGGRLWI
jgi:hypothetical protein